MMSLYMVFKVINRPKNALALHLKIACKFLSIRMSFNKMIDVFTMSPSGEKTTTEETPVTLLSSTFEV